MHFVIICVSLLKILPSAANVVNYYSRPNEHQLSKNYFLHTFPVLEKEKSISFEVNPFWYEEGTRNILHLVFFSNGEISSDLYRFVQCDIKKCAFDSLKMKQNPQNCD